MPDRFEAAKKAQVKVFGTLTGSAERVLDHGEGIYLFDHEGKRYIDFCSNMIACCLGHGDQRITQAVVEQMKKVAICFNAFWINEREGELGMAPGLQEAAANRFEELVANKHEKKELLPNY